ncbi:TetR/AcrR family transcriptional regulator [Azospirillum sp. sgz301742]
MTATPIPGAPAPAVRRGDRKRAEIVDAAERLFLGEGYGATSMDRIAAEAGASKRTVYNHFATKEELFRAVVERLYTALLDGAAVPTGGPTAAEALGAFARAFVGHMTSPRLQALIRLVIAESARFPEITPIYFAAGKEPAVGRLSDWLAGEAAAGRLAVDNPTLAAQQFLGCIKEALFWPRLLGLEPLYAPQIVLDEAVATFLARYGA